MRMASHWMFVKTATTYDPVFVETGSTSGNQVRITSGVDATEVVVVQGALSLYAESKKSQQSKTAQPAAEPASAPPAGPTETTPAASPAPQFNPLGIGAAVVGALALGGVAMTRLGRRSQ
jgi:cation efflux system membrane fusion protein